MGLRVSAEWKTPVVATLIASFGTFPANQQVSITKVAGNPKDRMMVCVGEGKYVPFSKIDQEAQQVILKKLRQYDVTS